MSAGLASHGFIFCVFHLESQEAFWHKNVSVSSQPTHPLEGEPSAVLCSSFPATHLPSAPTLPCGESESIHKGFSGDPDRFMKEVEVCFTKGFGLFNVRGWSYAVLLVFS